MRADAILAFAALLMGCGEPAAPAAPQRTATLVQSVPTETTGFELRGVPHTHEVWRDMVANAARSVDVASFYVSNHEPGRLEPVLAEMERAVARGVRVRLLVDDSFAEKYPAELDRMGRTVAVRRLDLKSRTGGVQHAKYMVVDDRVLYVGSANFDWRALEHIHELGVLVEAPAMAHALSELFQLDWDLAGAAVDVVSAGEDWPAVEMEGMRFTLLASPKEWLPAPRAWDLPRILAAIDRAKTSIAIQLLSYDAAYRDGAPWTEIHAALLGAARRGVIVRLVLSHWQKDHMKAIVELQRENGVEVALVEVPEHSTGHIPFARVVHAKYMVIDGDVSWIGTSNWKGDYFYKSRNVGLLVHGAGIAAPLVQLFDSVYNGPYAQVVDVDATRAAPDVGSK